MHDEAPHRVDVLGQLGDLPRADDDDGVVQVAVRHLPHLPGEPAGGHHDDAAQPCQQRHGRQPEHDDGADAQEEPLRRGVEVVPGVVP